MTLWITITTRTAITRIRSNQLQPAFNSNATGPLRFAKTSAKLSGTLTRLLQSYRKRCEDRGAGGTRCPQRVVTSVPQFGNTRLSVSLAEFFLVFSHSIR
jgi:hypothetical protein